MKEEKTALYKAYGADGECLYIGISKSWARRWCEHFALSPFSWNVRRLEVEWFPNRHRALRAEYEAVITEQPKFNAQTAAWRRSAGVFAETADEPTL